MRLTGIHEVFAAAWHLLADCKSPSAETSELLRYANTKDEPGTAALEPWLSQVAEPFFGGDQSVVVINRNTHPHLVDHTLNIAPAIPAAYAIEWFARAAKSRVSSAQTLELKDVKVLKGVIADGFDDGVNLELRIVVTNKKNNCCQPFVR